METSNSKLTYDVALQILNDAGLSRITEKIVLLWGFPQLDSYLSSLTISDREDRVGFSPDVFSALWFLMNLHLNDFGSDRDPIWSNEKI